MTLSRNTIWSLSSKFHRLLEFSTLSSPHPTPFTLFPLLCIHSMVNTSHHYPPYTHTHTHTHTHTEPSECTGNGLMRSLYSFYEQMGTHLCKTRILVSFYPVRKLTVSPMEIISKKRLKNKLQLRPWTSNNDLWLLVAIILPEWIQTCHEIYSRVAHLHFCSLPLIFIDDFRRETVSDINRLQKKPAQLFT